MMGMIVQREPGLGYTPAIAAIPASGPAAPIVAMVLGAVSLGVGLFKLFHKSDPRKVPDTIVVENAQRSFNAIWETVSGEHFAELFNGGRPSLSETDPDAMQWGRTGNPQVDIGAALAAADATYRDAVAHLLRQESVANIDGNYGPLLARLNAVKNARAADPAWAAANLGSTLGLPTWALVAAAGVALLVVAA